MPSIASDLTHMSLKILAVDRMLMLSNRKILSTEMISSDIPGFEPTVSVPSALRGELN
jgi:hypothetical protein